MDTISTTPMRRFFNYLSLIKFSHTVFALPFALIGFTLGCLQVIKTGGFHFPVLLFLKMLLCMIFARSAAMSFNRYLDRHYDALNPRTAMREVPAGIIKSQHALLFTIISSALFILTTFFINMVCFSLSFLALFIILFYSYTKRFTALCHIILGVGLSLSPIGAYLAVTGYFSLLPVLFSLSVLTWVAGFDVIYALQDREFDKRHRLHSIPAAIGAGNSLKISSVLHVFSAIFVICAGVYGHFNWLYWTGALFYIALLIYQHLLVKPSDLSKVNIAFANTNGFASVVFALFTIVSLFI